MRFTVLATFTALVTYIWFLIKVGRARKQFGIESPRVTGDINFERVYRVQQNTVEQLVLFLPSLWLFGTYVSDSAAGVLGLTWTGARAVYAANYYADAKKRGPGAALTSIISLILLIGGALGALTEGLF